VPPGGGAPPPPAVSRPQYATQVGSLRQLGTDAHALAQALGQGQTSVGPLLSSFDRAALGTRSPAALKAQASAIRAYDARVASLQTLSHSIDVERARLSNTLK
jgi:hypothetical protein